MTIAKLFSPMDRIEIECFEDRIIMFCPKCGSQNADETKFCRGCGADLSGLLSPRPRNASTPPVQEASFAEKHIELFGSGLRGVMIGAGFLITSGLAFVISTRLSVLGIFLLAFASYFLGTGISRLIQAKGIKALRKSDELAALPPVQTEYIKPSRSIYQTDDLIELPLSVTEHTTRHLQMDSDAESMTLPKK